MIRIYPSFTKVTWENREEIMSFTSHFEVYSDFNFTSLFCWDTDGTAEVSWLNGNLVLRLPDYISGKPVLTLLGNCQIDDSLHILLAECPILALIPQEVVNNIEQPGEFITEEDRDNFDYIYNVATIANLPGGRLKKKRNKVSSAQKLYGERLVSTTYSTISPELRSGLDAIIEGWSVNTHQLLKDQLNEKEALARLFANAKIFNLIITYVTIDSVPVGFSINEVIHNDYAICHFEKALPTHDQLSSVVTNQAAKDLLAAGCNRVNWEQDLGLEGLRKSKMSFQPACFLKKYTLKHA